MRHLVIVSLILWGLLQLAGLIWLSRDSRQGHSLAQLAQPPPHHLSQPYRNAYFFLLGFTASPSLEPAKVGYDTWVEVHRPSGATAFDYDKPGRSDLRISLTFRQALPSWEADDPLGSFGSEGTALRTAVARYRLLLARYEHCLEMPFEDWGFGHIAVPRYEDIMIAHRLYIADGFVRSAQIGLERMFKELVFWRSVLRESATITTKVMAQIVVQDDVRLLSRILARPRVDTVILENALSLVIPLTSSEYSLRVPIQHQIAVAMYDEHAQSTQGNEAVAETDRNREWLSAAAQLPPDAFKKIEHPLPSPMLSILLTRQRIMEEYADYYDALINVSGTGVSPLPKLQDRKGGRHPGFVAKLFNPVLFQPDWETFRFQLMETDARLRLTSLQIQLRKPSATTAVPTRLAEVGSQYFDPFTGLPMLWSPTQQKLYSVGKDYLDDGGDPSFDITVPAIIGSLPRPSKPSRSS